MADVVLNGHSIDNGVIIKFRSVNTYDTVIWSGEVVGIVKYQVAKLVTDVDAFHQQVLSTDIDAEPVLNGDFVLINGSDGTSPAKQVAFAVSHILETSVEVIEVNTHLDLRILNIPDTSIANVIQLLNEHGFQTKIIG